VNVKSANVESANVESVNIKSANAESANAESVNAKSANAESLRTPNQRMPKVWEHRVSERRKLQFFPHKISQYNTGKSASAVGTVKKLAGLPPFSALLRIERWPKPPGSFWLPLQGEEGSP
jgi:hypothetical protein